MKKVFIVFALMGSALVQAKKPYYLKNIDHRKIDAIQQNKACDDCGGDCNGGENMSILKKQTYVSLKKQDGVVKAVAVLKK
jgi:hypothetical protein